MIISPDTTAKFFARLDSLAARLFLAKDPEQRKTPYTWLGKRAHAVIDITDGLINFFTPKNHWSKLGISFCLWEAERVLRKQIDGSV